METDTHFQSLT